MSVEPSRLTTTEALSSHDLLESALAGRCPAALNELTGRFHHRQAVFILEEHIQEI